MPTPPPPKSSPIKRPSAEDQQVIVTAPKSVLGQKLIRRILEENDAVTFFDVVTDSLLPDELQVYEFVKKFYRKHKQLPSVGIVSSNGYLLPEADAPVDYFLKRIHDRAIYNAINTRQKLLAEAMSDQDMEKAVDTLRDTLSAITALKNPNSYTTIKHIAKRVRDQYEVAKHTPGLLGITTGYPSLDYQTNGVMPGDLLVIVARPGMGKTYILLKMAHSAWKAGKRVAVITMEMVNDALVRRWIGVDAKLNPDLIRRGELDIHGEKVFHQTIDSYDSQDNAYFMAGNFSKSVAAVEEMIIQLDPDIIYIDASYLLSPSVKGRDDNGAAIAKKVVNELKALAVAYKKQICITVQFNRNVRRDAKLSGKGGSRFDLADIGGTDAVGQDADIVLGLRLPDMPYRDTHRIVEVMKIREGVAKDFATRFGFWPVSFDEVPLESIVSITDDEDENEEDKEVSKKPSWMLS